MDSYALASQLKQAIEAGKDILVVVDNALAQAWQEGHDAGFSEGHTEGYADGRAAAAQEQRNDQR